jgi:aminodeoxyfutalosine deaminase
VTVTNARTYPKIELHVHLEATVRPGTLLQIARRNGFALPADSVEGLTELYRFRDFDHFIETWIVTTPALQKAADFRQVVVDYAAEAARFGCVYMEAIFTPAEPAMRGVPWEEVLEGYCDGGQEARQRHGVEVRFTLDIPRGFDLEWAQKTAVIGVAYRERGVVGLGLGGREAAHPPEPYAPAFAIGRAGGLGSAPHAGEAAGPASIRGALDALKADRIRHGIRAVEDAALLGELAERGIVCDVTPISNLRTRVVASLEEHPLRQIVAAGVRCSISTDDPALFDTDLGKDCAAAESLGLPPRDMYFNALGGVLCDKATRSRLRAIGEAFDWDAPAG